MPNDVIIKMVENDIARCENAQESKNGTKRLYNELIARYTTFIPSFAQGFSAMGKVAVVGEFDYRDELASIKSRLETLLVAGYYFELPQSDSHKEPIVNIELNNHNQVDMVVSVTFENVANQIREMSTLSVPEKNEIAAKIAELEKIVSSKVSKKEKWDRAKSILAWVADKSVDVGIALLPLFLGISG